MSKAYATQTITREVSKTVKPFRLVKLEDGKVEHNGADTPNYGAITYGAVPTTETDTYKQLKAPNYVAVITGAGIVKVETDGNEIEDGADVFAAADGKVSASGSVKVGTAHGKAEGGYVKLHQFGHAINASGN